MIPPETEALAECPNPRCDSWGWCMNPAHKDEDWAMAEAEHVIEALARRGIEIRRKG